MRLYVFLFLAAAALQCQAASLPDKTPIQTIAQIQNIKGAVKLIKDDKEEPAQNNASEEELIQPINTVPEIGNELRKIPVKVVPEVKPALKSDIEKDTENEIKDEKIEKPQEPIKPEIQTIEQSEDPIKPEVQKIEQPAEPIKPEVQKPEDDKKEEKPSVSDISDFDEEVEEPGSPLEDSNLSLNFLTEALSTAHQSVLLTIETFAKAFQTWMKDQSALLPSEEQIKAIIDTNIKKINETLTGYFSPAQAAKLVETDANDSTNHVEVVESDLKKLEKDFENDVKFALRADNGTSGSSGGSGGGGQVVIQNLQQLIQQGFSNITSSFTSLFNQGSGDNSTNNLFVMFGQNLGSFFNPQPSNSSAQSDEGAPSRPNIFQSIQNIFRPPFQQNQGNQPQADQVQPNRPIINAIQGNPIVQSISGVFNRNPVKPAAPAKPEVAKPEAEKPEAEKPADEGSNIVPEPSADPVEEKPQEDKVKPESTPEYHAGGPIQQAIQKNPIVQGIAGAVQKIQQTYQNPEKPRKVGHLIHHFHGIHHQGTHGGQGGGDKFTANVDHIDSADVTGHRSGGSTESRGQSEASEQSGDKKPDCEKKETSPKEDKVTLDEEIKKVEQKTE